MGKYSGVKLIYNCAKAVVPPCRIISLLCHPESAYTPDFRFCCAERGYGLH